MEAREAMMVKQMLLMTAIPQDFPQFIYFHLFKHQGKD
jgi:hypothetical protein